MDGQQLKEIQDWLAQEPAGTMGHVIDRMHRPWLEALMRDRGLLLEACKAVAPLLKRFAHDFEETADLFAAIDAAEGRHGA